MAELLVITLALAFGDLKHFDDFAENPSMEDDRDRDTFPDGWQPYAFDSPAQLAWDSSVARTGSRSLRISDSFRPGDQGDWKRCTGRWVARRRPIQPGTQYELEVWVKAQDVTGQAFAHLAWQHGAKWLSESSTQRVSGSGDWRKLTVSADAPAGKHGFLRVRPDGHFYFEDGTRARFFGTNLGGTDVAPPEEQSRVLAARFAKYGVNMIRLHSIDGSYTGVIDYARGNSRHFIPEALDRMDYLIAELKKNGIYIYLDLLDYRMFRDADGVKEGDQFTHNWAGSMKGASIFDERMIELQKEYAVKLLTHRNPYTGLRYVDDPAIAVVETTNENGVFYFLLNRDLSRPCYREQLRLRWNRWLKSRYGNHAKLARAWSGNGADSELVDQEDLDRESIRLPKAELTRFSKGFMPDRSKYLWGPARMRDALEFLGDVQENYYRQMRGHLKETVGVRVPITGTNQMFVLRDMEINARMSDFVSRNQYWRHPSVRAKPFMRFSNMPMVRSDLTGRTPLTVFAGSSVVGKPLTLAEFNFPWPNEYRCEGLLLGTAYACLQDLDGMTVDCETNFATITATSLDGRPIGRSRRILLTSVARAENTAQAFWPAPPNPKSWSPFMTWQIPARGRRPVIAEPVRANVTLNVPNEASVYPLDTTGKRRGRLDADNTSGTLTFDPASARSIWCEIVVE